MSAPWTVILFYKYVPIAEPAQFADAQRALCVSLGLKGRVLIASEGINGTLAGPAEGINEYSARLHADERFAEWVEGGPCHPASLPWDPPLAVP